MIVLKLAIAIVFVRGISTLYFLLRAQAWQKNAADIASFNNKYLSDVNYHILIPALREQKRIAETLKYFLDNFKSKNIKLTVITTQREFEKNFEGKSTNQIVKDFLKKNNCASFINVLDYPDAKGKMTHQLNYAVERVKGDCFIAIYNADSRPNIHTFDYVSSMVNKEKAEVFQQPAIFVKNYKKLNPFLRTSAILQSRWTFAHEITRLLRQSVSSNKFFRKYAYAHVVGHGLIIKKDVLEKVGRFPTGTMTEDLFLGYLLRSRGYNIFPIPFLELADSPETIKGLWNQKYVWFWGPMKSIEYFIHVFKNKAMLEIKSLLPPFVFMLEGLQSASAWLLSGPLVFVLLLAPFFTQSLFLISISYLSIFTYGPLQYMIFYFLNAKHIKKYRLKEIINIGVLSIPAIIFNSIPPYLSILGELRSKTTKQEVHKPKTDD